MDASAPYVESMYQQWLEDPQAVDASWQSFFRGYQLAQDSTSLGSSASPETAKAQSNVASLIYAYRSLGHLAAQTDPLAEETGATLPTLPALELDRFGLAEADLERIYDTGHLPCADQLPLREVIEILRQTYCGSVGAEYIHIQDRRMRRWLQERMEGCRNQPTFTPAQKRTILERLVDAELFESFTHARYPGQKRFSLEGGETLIPAICYLTSQAVELGIEEVVVGMTHRGRLNVLANILGMSYETIFSEFEGNFLPDSVGGDGDVKYHKGFSTTRLLEGRSLRISLTANPSHLEAVYPVVEGRVRAKQRQRDDTERRVKVLPLVMHGDAAFAGQGIVPETLNLSQLPGYQTGGTVHLVINNQIGFTTSPTESRSTAYATDVAKMIEAPILHVNGDDPEAVLHVVDVALNFRQTFSRDVVIDMICYRRHGHNEGDEPAFTQPVLYRKIRRHPSVRRRYTERLIGEGHLTDTDAEQIAKRFRSVLSDAHQAAQQDSPALEVQAFEQLWEGLDGPFTFDRVDTTTPHQRLIEVARAYCTVPDGFKLNPKVARALPSRLAAVEQGGELAGEIDWAFAELLAFGTLLAEGTPVRLSGQDSARGTFSQRHAAWLDMETGERYLPLNQIGPEQARFCCYNSTLSEASVLAFEYGYSLTEPRMLILWEAQFGDFANGAQVIIDQFIVDAESKWQRDSGLVMLLPHGYEGQGPEHSSAYLERYLAACAEDNIQVCYPSSPAQHFHLLRRQIKRPVRLPLIVMSPKSMLRNPRCVSPVSDLVDGGFEEVLDDPAAPAPGRVRRLVLCSGKLFWDLALHRDQQGIDDVALVRIEQLYPLHQARLTQVLQPYLDGGAKEVVWAQEESRNRGGWSFLMPRLLTLLPGVPLAYVGRRPSASPIVGSLRIFRQQQQDLVDEALRGRFVQRCNEAEREGICIELVGRS